jgi:hypothetical protein
MLRALRDERSKHRPRNPVHLSELIVTGQWSETMGEQPEPFLLHDNGTDSPERLLIFSTAENMGYLGQSSSLFMDGTFSVVPGLFSQLYVIHGQVGSVRCPLLYALMEKLTQASYEQLFQFVIDNCDCDPKFVTVDFEIAVHQAIRAVFDESVVIRGCFYHLTQSTWRKIQSLGLVNLYSTDDEFRLFCGKLDALAFLPLADIYNGMAHLKHIMPESASKLVEYFDETYVSGTVRRRPLKSGLVGFRLRRRQPKFPPSSWNCHDTTLNGDPRTNNICEGWNNGFAHLVDQNHPSIWKLIESLQKDAARVHITAIQDARGMRPKKRVRRNHDHLQQRLKNLCEDLNSGRKDMQQFLCGISHNIRFGKPNI